MTLLLSALVHPYFRELRFSESEVAGFSYREHCPACRSDSDPVDLVEIGQEHWSERIHLVQCRDCDHVYYLNPPSPDFLSDFYRQAWNSTRGETTHGTIAPGGKVKETAAALLQEVGRNDRDLAVLDIGCGLGAMLAGLERNGYSNIYGVEASEYRVAASAARFPDRIFRGGYQSVPADLSFDFIYSNHVFEHIHDPGEALAWAVERLRPGGVIAICVPSAWGEPVLNQALFLPHLHSFCHRSLAAMGRLHGLECFFWEGAKTEYEIMAVYFRSSAVPSLDTGRFIPAGDTDQARPRSQVERIRRPFQAGNRSHPDVHFALHAGDADMTQIAAEGGVREVGLGARVMARAAVPVQRALVALGHRKLSERRFARVRYVSGRFVGQDGAVPTVGGEDGSAVLHVK